MEVIGQFEAPQLLNATHKVTDFFCGTPSLDDWLKKRALANQMRSASRTFVLCQKNHVIGYYALAAGSVLREETSGRFRRNMPDPIPVVIVGRLAIDCAWQKHGLGRALVQDAIMRIHNASKLIGVHGILVHALLDQAKSFYEAIGFESSSLHPLTLMATMEDVCAILNCK